MSYGLGIPVPCAVAPQHEVSLGSQATRALPSSGNYPIWQTQCPIATELENILGGLGSLLT